MGKKDVRVYREDGGVAIVLVRREEIDADHEEATLTMLAVLQPHLARRAARWVVGQTFEVWRKRNALYVYDLAPLEPRELRGLRGWRRFVR
jgi:hypothetical protein